MNDTTQPEKMPLTSIDVAAEKQEELRRCLAATFPEIMAEAKIDLDQLRRVLGEWVEPDRERFGLNWPGKAACMKVIQAPSVGTLKPCKEESVNWDTTENVFIEGDNLEVLKLLQKAYFGKIKAIYIDPPYNTGKEFIYPDKYAETLDTYLEYTGQKDSDGRKFGTNTDTSGRFHSRWLSMMFPRLYLAKNLLRQDGAIFVSIDDHEQPRLRLLCDQIFGEENFVTNIVWQKRYTRSNNTREFTDVVEHIVVYAKSADFAVNLLPRTEEADARYSNPDKDPRGVWKGASFLNPASPQERPNLSYPLRNPNTGQVTHPTRSAWRRSKEAFAELQSDGRLYWGPDGKAAVPTVKMYLSEARGLTPINFWEHAYAGHTDEGTRDLEARLPGGVFDNPKPVKLIQRVIEHTCDDESIVLDFFAGSGVAAEAVLRSNAETQSNRKFILVQLPEPCEKKAEAAASGFNTISEIARARIVRAIEKSKTDDGLLQTGGGFRSFKLDRSTLTPWEGSAEGDSDLISRLDQHVEHVSKTAEADDILFELLLASGFSLTSNVARLDLCGKPVFSIAEGALLVCLDRALTQEVIDAMADMEPSRVICLDAGFQGNDQLKANAVQTFKARARNRETAIEFRTV